MRRLPKSQPRHVVRYRLLDAKRGFPKRRITVHASPIEIRQLIEDGFLVRRSLFSRSHVKRFRSALSDVLNAEREEGHSATDGCFGSPYLRHLIDKHEAFIELFRLRSTLSIARAVLGPQLKFEEVTARVTDLSTHSPSTPWHIHLRVIPEPVPAFFAYPHAIECLLYLDDVDIDSGPICVLPGSHLRMSETYPVGDVDEKPGQETVLLKAGDCLVMHPNLWHRALPSVRRSGLRRLVIFGYFPSWVGGEERGSAPPPRDGLESFRRYGNAVVRELAGEFYWG